RDGNTQAVTNEIPTKIQSTLVSTYPCPNTPIPLKKVTRNKAKYMQGQRIFIILPNAWRSGERSESSPEGAMLPPLVRFCSLQYIRSTVQNNEVSHLHQSLFLHLQEQYQ